MIPQPAFTLDGVLTCALYLVVSPLPPGWLYGRMFLLLFTTLLHCTMHLSRWNCQLIFLLKRNTFENANGPLAHGAPWAPSVHKGPQMALQMTLQMSRFTPQILHHGYCTMKFTPQILQHEYYTMKFTPQHLHRNLHHTIYTTTCTPQNLHQ